MSDGFVYHELTSASRTDWRLFLIPLATPFGPLTQMAWSTSPERAFYTAGIVTDLKMRELLGPGRSTDD